MARLLAHYYSANRCKQNLTLHALPPHRRRAHGLPEAIPSDNRHAVQHPSTMACTEHTKKAEGVT